MRVVGITFPVIEEISEVISRERIVLYDDGLGYDRARECWNGMINKFPLAIVRAISAEEISQVIIICQKHKQQITIRGGGHNVAGCCIADGAILLDLSLLSDVKLEDNRIIAGGGSLWAAIDKCGRSNNTSVPCGVISHTGVGGLTLGGGIGWLSRSHGLSCDALQGVEVVCASGEIKEANEQVNSDLFWALRGGGGNFAVVTKFYFQSFPVPPKCNVIKISFKLSSAEVILREYAALCSRCPNSLTFYCFIAPSGVHVFGVDVGIPQANWQELSSFPEDAILGVTSFQYSMEEVNSLFDRGNSPGREYYWSRSTYLKPNHSGAHDYGSALNSLLVDVFLPLIDDMDKHNPNITVNIEIVQMGGKIAEIPLDSCAFFHRSAAYEIHCIFTRKRGSTDIAAEAIASQCRKSARYYAKMILPFIDSFEYCSLGGGYINTDNLMSTGEIGIEYRVFGKHYQKLREVKSKFDPQNFFNKHHPVFPMDKSSIVQYSTVSTKVLFPNQPNKKSSLLILSLFTFILLVAILLSINL